MPRRTKDLPKAFHDRLAEAAAWCSHALREDDPRDSLRTFLPAPGRSKWGGASDFPDDSTFLNDVETNLTQVLERRAAALTELRSQPVDVGGRVICCEFLETLLDGFPGVVSNGFFDVVDLPPCDTWIGLVTAKHLPAQRALNPHSNGQILAAWVPAPFIACADAGVRGCATNHLFWFDDLGASLKT